jgi:general secretion pathway protein D
LRFDPPSATLKMGETTTIGLAIDGAKDLFSVPLLLQYNPAVIQVEEVRNGGFLSGGTQEIAIVQRVDQAAGHAIVSATRQPNTQGVNGSGTLLGIIVRAVGPGTSKLQIGLVNAKDSQQRPLVITAGEATIQVQ